MEVCFFTVQVNAKTGHDYAQEDDAEGKKQDVAEFIDGGFGKRRHLQGMQHT